MSDDSDTDFDFTKVLPITKKTDTESTIPFLEPPTLQATPTNLSMPILSVDEQDVMVGKEQPVPKRYVVCLSLEKKPQPTNS